MSLDTSDPRVIQESRKNPKREVAVVGLMNSHGCILLVRTRKFPDHWQPIGGGVQPEDASPLDAVIRELKEEAGLTFVPPDFKLHLTTGYDFGEGHIYFYIASVPETTELTFDPEEIAEWKWFPIDSLDVVAAFPAAQSFFKSLKI
jgi:8-oxo-dGTP pyrophosphatase MutT (NUDIX family)